MVRSYKGYLREPILNGFALLTDAGMRLLEINTQKGITGAKFLEGLELIPQQSLRGKVLSDNFLYPPSHMVPENLLRDKNQKLIGFPVTIIKITEPVPEAQPFPPELYLHCSALSILESTLKSLEKSEDSIGPNQNKPISKIPKNRRSNAPEPNAYQEMLLRTAASRYEEGKSLHWKRVLDSLKDYIDEGDKLEINPRGIQLTIAPGTDDEDMIKRKISTFKKNLSNVRKKLPEITVTE